MSYCYVDTSALIKCYVEEAGSNVMRIERQSGRGWFTSRLTEAEGIAALNRLRRDGVLTVPDTDAAVQTLREDFGRLHVVDVSEHVLAKADAFAKREGLRGCDLVHVTTALWLKEEGLLSSFWCSDKRLGNSATMLGLEVLDPSEIEVPLT